MLGARRELDDLEPVDARAGRALPEPADGGRHGLRVALELGLHRAVESVADPAGEAEPTGRPASAVAERDALHAPVRHDPSSNPFHVQDAAIQAHRPRPRGQDDRQGE
jgi:hypothetical protein